MGYVILLENQPLGFQMKMQMEIRFNKCGISNQPNVCIFDDPCLSKFGALRGSCPHPGRQFVGLLCVSLAAPESPPIVSGVSDMHPSDCPNVEETRNPMQTFSRKKCSHFSQTNFHLHFHMKSPSMFLNHITYQHKAQYASCGSSSSCRISTASSLGSSSASTRHL